MFYRGNFTQYHFFLKIYHKKYFSRIFSYIEDEDRILHNYSTSKTKQRGRYPMENRINHTQSMTHVLTQKIFSDTEITAQFMSDILELPILEVKSLKPYEVLDDNRTSITTLAQLASGSEMIVEIQIAEEVDINESYYLYLSNYFTKNKELFEAKELNPMYFINEVLPFYTIYITQKNCFDDERMFHSFSLLGDSSNESLKVDFKGFDEPQNLVEMKFLELDKYHTEYTQPYNKIRWIELFSNHPFTEAPDSLLKQAEQIRKTLEERKE